MRQPYQVYARADHGNWWVNFRIVVHGKRRRCRIDTGVARPSGRINETEAARKAAAIWLSTCERHGVAHAGEVAAALDVDTLSLLEQWVDGELAARARKRGPTYADKIETDIARHVAKAFPTVSAITRDAWNQHQDAMHADGLSLRTCQRVTTNLRLFLRYCVRIGALAALPMLETASGEEVAAKQAERRAFTPEERDLFLAQVERLDARAHRIYTTLLYTGLRKSGLERVLHRWVDWRTGYLTMPAAAQKRGAKERRFYLHPRALAAMRAEIAVRGEIAPGEPIFGPFDYDGRGEPETRRGLFWEAVRAAGIAQHGLTAHHVTRHTACSIAGNNGATLAELMALGGWRTPGMAMRYLHVDAELSRGAVERL